MDFVKFLPTEVTVLIFDYLRAEDLLSCAKCSKAWRQNVNSDKFWYKVCFEKEWAGTDRTSCQSLRNALYLKDPEAKPCLQNALDPLCDWWMYYSECMLMEKRWRTGKYVRREIARPDVAEEGQLWARFTACDGKLLAVGDCRDKVILWNITGEAAYIVNTYQSRLGDAFLSGVHLHQNHLLVERGKILRVHGITNLRGVDQSNTLYELNMASFLECTSPETFDTVQRRVKQLTGGKVWELVDGFYVAFQDDMMALSRHVTSHLCTFRISTGELIQSIALPGSWCCIGQLLFFHGDLYIPTITVLGEAKGSVLIRNIKERSWKTVAECSDIPIDVSVNEKIIVARTLSNLMQVWDRKEDERVPLRRWMFFMVRNVPTVLYGTKLVYIGNGKINIHDTASRETDTVSLKKMNDKFWPPNLVNYDFLPSKLVKGAGSLVVAAIELEQYLQICDIDTRALTGGLTSFSKESNLRFLWSDATKIIAVPELNHLNGYQNPIVLIDFRFNSC